jgi:hypothetical protein
MSLIGILRKVEILGAAGLFHAEFIADAEADKEEEDGAEDGLDGGKHFEPSERSIN